MTLVLGLVTWWGVWLAADNQITRGGAKVRADAIKFLWSKHHDGSMIVTFAGLADDKKGRPLADWMLGQLRGGEPKSVEQAVEYLRERATRDLSPICVRTGTPHLFVAAGYMRGQPFFAEIRNVRPPAPWSRPPEPEFHIAGRTLDKGSSALVAGGAGAVAVAEVDRRLMQKMTQRRPAKRVDIDALLAGIIRRTAAGSSPAARTVSASSVVGFLPSNNGPARTGVHGTIEGAPEFVSVPSLLFGVDLTETTALMVKQFRDGTFGTDPDADAERDAAAQRSVTPDP